MSVHKWVAIVGGADPADPLEPNESTRHTAVGGLLICVAAWACATATGTIHSSLEVSWPSAIAGGLLVAAFIFWFDRLITTTLLKEDKARYRTRVILIRGMLSLTLGLAISHATILFMYRDTIAQIISAKNEATAQADTNNIRAHSQWPPAMAEAQQQIAAYRNQILAAKSSFASSQAELNHSRKAWLNDRLCVNGDMAADGDQCGPGVVSDTLRRSYEKLSNSFPAVQNAFNSTVASLGTSITTLNNTITADTKNLNTQIQEGTRADLANTGLAAQSEALWTLLRQDVLLWLLPAFFIVIDLSVALMKGILPESDFDRKRRWDREQEDMLRETVRKSRVWRQVAEHTARRRADVATARADATAARDIAALQSRQAPSGRTPSQRKIALGRTPSRRKLALVGFSASLVCTLVLTLTASPAQGPSLSVGLPLTADGGHSIKLDGGERLTIPLGAISGNAPVTATYTAAQSWPGNTAASNEVKFTTTGKVVGKPLLSLQVPSGERQLALSGSLHIAFRAPDSSGWTAYPATYDAEADTMVAALTHFSTWRFWISDSNSDLARITRTLAEWRGRQARDVPNCTKGPKPPAWYNGSIGIGDDPELAVRGCVEGRAGDHVLDVQLVNNRPYGLVLHYGGAVKWGRHTPPATVADALRDAVGDYAAQTMNGLYLPPLSEASVGIRNIGNAKDRVFAIAPTAGTILGDALDVSLGSLIRERASAAAVKWATDVFAAAATGSCVKTLTGSKAIAIPGPSTVQNLLASTVFACFKDMVTSATRNGLAQRGDVGFGAIKHLSSAVTRLAKIISDGQWASIESGLGNVLSFGLDSKSTAAPELGFGFMVLSHHPNTGPRTLAMPQ